MTQHYMWKAVYSGGEVLDELKPDGTSNNFYDIDKTRLLQFIVHGNDFRVWFSAKTGEWFFNNEPMTLIPSEITNLPVSYADGLIQYKDGADYIIQKVVNTGSNEFQYGRTEKKIAAHYIGYKVTYGDKKYQVLFRIIPDDPTTAIPMDTKVDVRITITDLITGEVNESTVEVVK